MFAETQITSHKHRTRKSYKNQVHTYMHVCRPMKGWTNEWVSKIELATQHITYAPYSFVCKTGCWCDGYRPMSYKQHYINPTLSSDSSCWTASGKAGLVLGMVGSAVFPFHAAFFCMLQSYQAYTLFLALLDNCLLKTGPYWSLAGTWLWLDPTTVRQ